MGRVNDAPAGGTGPYDVTFARLAERARHRNAERVSRLAELLATPTDGDGVAERVEAVTLCHAVAGSAGTFGQDRVTEAARVLEDALRSGSDADVLPALRRLRAAVTRGS